MEPDSVHSVLLVQIKAGDVHPNNRDPSITGKKTQIDIVAPRSDSIANPTTALFSEGSDPEGLTRWPIKAWNTATENWIDTDIKVSGIEQAGHYEEGQRIKLGGMDPNSWSEIVWANMGHYENDPFGFIMFVRKGIKSPPYSFSIADDEILRKLISEYGPTPGTWKSNTGKTARLFGTPKSKAAVINGIWDSDELHHTIDCEYLYAATNPCRDGPRVGWIKIGKTKRSPIKRLKEYDNAFEFYDMNHIRMTLNCDDAEKELIRRLELVGMERKRWIDSRGKKTEWFKSNSIQVIKSCIDEVVKFYPHPDDVKLEPIIRSLPGESWLNMVIKKSIKRKFLKSLLQKLRLSK